MQGQSSPVQVKDPYTGSILICRLILPTHRSVQCTPPKNNQKLIDGSNKKKTKKNKAWFPWQSFLVLSRVQFVSIREICTRICTSKANRQHPLKQGADKNR